MTKLPSPLVPDPKGPWREAELVVIDFETTGTDPKEARVIEIGVVLVEHGVITETFSALVNPGVPIPAGASAVHGIYDKDVASVGTFEHVLGDLYTLCECAVPVAYNAPYDRTILHNELDRIGDTSPDIPAFDRKYPWVDPLVWVRDIDKFAKGTGRHKLTVTAERYKIKLDNAHRALADAEATAKVLFALSPKIPVDTLRDLIKRQTYLAEKQELMFASWRAKKKETRDKEAAT